MNPQAFPQHTVYLTASGQTVQQGPVGGMALRDYFAARAMQGLQANPTDEVMNMGFDSIAQYAYEQADAMLKAREA